MGNRLKGRKGSLCKSLHSDPNQPSAASRRRHSSSRAPRLINPFRSRRACAVIPASDLHMKPARHLACPTLERPMKEAGIEPRPGLLKMHRGSSHGSDIYMPGKRAVGTIRMALRSPVILCSANANEQPLTSSLYSSFVGTGGPPPGLKRVRQL